MPPVETDADRAVFLNADEFGAVATYTPAVGAAVAGIAGQFDNPSSVAPAVDADDVDMIVNVPTFHCRTSDLPPTANGGDAGDRLTVGVLPAFRVLDLKHDGSGMTMITLAKTA